MSFLGDIGSAIMWPLYWVTSLIMVGWHQLWSLVFPADSGAAWTLSIVGLTLVIRAALIPLFVKQIKSSRNMQLLQPRVKELQKKYGHDRERLAQEQMKLYRETGTNPFASCLPILLQMPIFFALFRLIDKAADGDGHSFLKGSLVESFRDAEIFQVPLRLTFLDNNGQVSVQVLAAVLVLAMTATTFLTQRQLMAKNMPPDALTGPYAQQQKILLYVLPLVFAVGGVAFPVALLIYWTTSNLWTMGQQFYVIRNNPAPGTPAFKAKEERDRLKRRKRGEPEPEEAAPAPPTDAQASRSQQQRQQPRRLSRSERAKEAQGKQPGSPAGVDLTKQGGPEPEPRPEPASGSGSGGGSGNGPGGGPGGGRSGSTRTTPAKRPQSGAKRKKKKRP